MEVEIINYFDDESKIIEFFQTLFPVNTMWLLPENSQTQRELLKIVSSIALKEEWGNWQDTSKKSDPPPDYVNHKDRLMMEVMRIDDHSRINSKGKIDNPLNKLESKKQWEISALQKDGKFPTSNNGVIMNLVTDLPSSEDHNYTFYLDSFKWVMGKHKASIELYRNNHPGYKLVFFIFDESTPYVVAESAETASEGVIKGKPYFMRSSDLHLPFMDVRFVDELRDIDIDYVLWYMPYKHIEMSEDIAIPNFAAIDIKNLDKLLLVDYPIDRIMSFEE